MARPVWLEVALNGPWSRKRQPRIPVRVAEIVEEAHACAGEGAAILHVHAYDEATGRQKDDWEIYARIIEGVRARDDVIVYPTISGGLNADAPQTPAERYAAIEELGRRGLIEWSVVDPGSTNFSHRDDMAAGRTGGVYLNPEVDVRFGLELAAWHKVHPSYAIYEPGFLRLGAALKRAFPLAPQPIYRFMFTDGFTFGFPPAVYALEAYLKLLAAEAPGAPWMTSGLAVDVRPLIEATVARGGHVRVGLEDAPFGSELTNLQWTKDAVRRIRAAGGESATAQAVRAALRG